MAAEVELVNWKASKNTNGLRSDYHNPGQRQYSTDSQRWAPSPNGSRFPPGWWYRMQRSCAEPPPQCAFNPQEQQAARPKDDTKGRRNPPPMHRVNKGEPQPMSGWPPPTFENSNTSWEGDWSNASSNTPPIKTEPGYYGNRVHYADWSPEDSSSSNYGQHSSQHYYESSNGFYGYNYGYQQQQPYPGTQPQPLPPQQYGQLEGGSPYGGGVPQRNHIPSSSYPPKMGGFEYQKKQMTMRNPVAEHVRVQIKQEPEDSSETQLSNFSSVFTKSIMINEDDTENAFLDETNNPPTNNGNAANNIVKPYEPLPHHMMQVPTIEEPSTYQRLSNPGSHYGPGPVSTFQDVGCSSGGLGYYGRTPENPDPGLSNVVEELGTNTEGYHKPFFDTMHQFTPSESKNPAKKRKINAPTMSPENSYLTPESNSRKKTPRLTPSYPSDSQWTPNSFAFSDIHVKQEPMDDYNSPSDISLQSSGGVPFKDSNSPNSNGTAGNGSKSPDHPKPPPRKRSPATCFDRFEKKSTPANKKVSPLSVYAKVQENVVLSVKCRRYKKRTKPITGKEESACPGREEMELYKQNSLTPDQAARQVVGDLLERVELFEERSVIDGPNLSQLDYMKIRELVMQFCLRHGLDYQDFENLPAILRPRIVSEEANSAAKNSDRASAIRKRTSTISTSDVKVEVEQQQPQPAKKPSSKAEKKNNGTEAKPSRDEPKEIRRVLRSLPGRPKVVKEELDASPRRSYSTRSSKDTTSDNAKEVSVSSSVSSSDSDSEGGREAEVRKKTQPRLKKRKKMPAAEVVTTPARNSRSTTRTNYNASAKNSKSEERGMCTRSREAMKTKAQPPKKPPSENPSRINLRSRRDTDSKTVSRDRIATRSSSVEIVNIKTEINSVHDAIESVIGKFVEEKVNNERVTRRTSSARRSPKVEEENSDKKNLRSSTRSSSRIDSVLRKKRKFEEEWESVFKALEESKEKPKVTRKRPCRSLEAPRTLIREIEVSRKDFKVPKDIPKKSTQKSSPKALSDKTSVKNSPSSDKSEAKELSSQITRKVLRKSSSQSNINQNTTSDNGQKSNSNSKRLTKIKKSNATESVSVKPSNTSPRPLKTIKKEVLSDDSCEKTKVADKITRNTSNKKNLKLSSTSPETPKLKNNSKKIVIEDSLSDSGEDNEDKASKKLPVAQVPSTSKSPKQHTSCVIEISSDSSIESDEPLQVLKDRKVLVKRKTRSMRSKKLSPKEKSRKIEESPEKLNTKIPIEITKSSEDCSESISSKKPSFEDPINSKPKDSLETIKPGQEDVSTLTKPPEVSKTLLTGSRRRKATVKSEKFIKREIIDFTELSKNIKAVPNSAKFPISSSAESNFVPTTNNSAVTTPPAKGKNVDDLVAAVSSLVESESKSEKENEEKTLAAHSLLELGNSPLFVGSVPTSNPEVIDLTLPSSNSPSLFKENFGEPGLELYSGEHNLKSLLISQPFCSPTGYDKPSVNSSLIYSKHIERYEKQVAINTPYIYRNPEKPVAFNPPYTTSNSENYEKPIAVTTPFVFRNSDKYEKQIAVNTPYIHRSPEKYEKQVAINTPYIYRNSDKYEKQVAVNTPYMYKNGDSQEKTGTSSLLMRNLQKRRNVKDRRLIKGEIPSQIEKPPSTIKDNDMNNNTNKSNPVELPASSVSNASPSLNGNNLRANHHSIIPNGVCVKPSSKPEGNEFKSQDTNPEILNLKSPFQRKHHSYSNHEHRITQAKSSQVHSERPDSGKALNLCNIPEKKAVLNGRKTTEERLPKLSMDVKPLMLKPVKLVSRPSHTIPPADTSDDQPMNLSRAATASLRKVPSSGLIKRCAPRLRSESEDSDGKLVIDLDRRPSVDERAHCSPLQSPVPAIDTVPSEPAPFRSAEENEAGRTLLELTRSLVPAPGAVGRTGGVSSAELDAKREGDESILRTLLLESGAIGHRTSQDRSLNGSDSSSNTSSNSKHPLTRFLMMCKTNSEEDPSTFSSSESTSIDGKKFSLGRHILV